MSWALEPEAISTRPSPEVVTGQKYEGSRTSEPMATRICSVPGSRLSTLSWKLAGFCTSTNSTC